MASPIELLVRLGIDDAQALASIQQSLRRIQSQSRIDLNVNSGNSNRVVNDITNSVNRASGSLEGFSDRLSSTLRRVAGFSIVYGGINTLRNAFSDLTEQVISLDTQLVGLRRVLDLPDYEFNNLLESTITNVDRLSGNVRDYLELVGEFGRSGLNGDQAIELANTATLLQNISDLDASGSFDALTAAMINFNIAAEDSIVIADALNEVA